MSLYDKSAEVKKELSTRYGGGSSRSNFTKRDKKSRQGKVSRGSRRYVRGR